MSRNTQISSNEIWQKKERNYKRNFMSLMMEAFLFSFALAMFSPENVLPVYVDSLSEKAIFLALISAIYYGLSYGCTVFSCVLGVNAKSPKWISVVICFLQRIGFFAIFMSTFLAEKNVELALVVFFISFALYSASAGMSSPLFAQMVGTSIHRNVGTFYGAYSMVGSASGVLASLILTQCLSRMAFPISFRTVFMLGLFTALLATGVVSFGVREVTDDRIVEHIRLRDILPISRQILRENRDFRHFALIKVLVGAAEFAIPYYIIVASGLEGTPAGFVGTMTTVYLISKVVSSLILGRIADRFNAIVVLRCACICGALAAFLAIIVKDYRFSYIMYICLAVAVNGVVMSNNVACVSYSKNVRTPIYAAATGLMCAPLYVISSFVGAAIVSYFSYSAVFMIAMAVYTVSALLTFLLTQQKKSDC